MKTIYVFLIFCSIADEILGRKTFEILLFKKCKEFDDLPIVFESFKRHSYGKNNHSISVTIKVKKDIRDFEGKINLWKCDAAGNPDTCEYVAKDLIVRDICQKMIQKNQVWTNFISGFTPNLDCPIKSATYKTECFMKGNALNFFPVPSGQWKTKGYLYSGDEILTCVDFIVKIITV